MSKSRSGCMWHIQYFKDQVVSLGMAGRTSWRVHQTRGFDSLKPLKHCLNAVSHNLEFLPVTASCHHEDISLSSQLPNPVIRP